MAAPVRPNMLNMAKSACVLCTTVKIKPVSNVRPNVRPQSFFYFNEIWYVGRGRRVMHDGMQYDPIKVKVTSLSKLEIRPQYLNLIRPNL